MIIDLVGFLTALNEKLPTNKKHTVSLIDVKTIEVNLYSPHGDGCQYHIPIHISNKSDIKTLVNDIEHTWIKCYLISNQ